MGNMRYIRTNGGIYEVIEECFKPMENNMVFIPQEGITKILKQANTIDELCDVFIIVRKDDIRTVSDLKTLKEMLLQRDCDIEFEVEDDYFYIGAIFTDKGLIYKAKMKGVLLSDEIDWELL